MNSYESDVVLDTYSILSLFFAASIKGAHSRTSQRVDCSSIGFPLVSQLLWRHVRIAAESTEMYLFCARNLDVLIL